jgi:uracil phosphoribosyltransferase
MVINLSEKNSLVSCWMSEIRDSNIQTDRMRFRRNLERIGEIAAYEISKKLQYEPIETPTALGIASGFAFRFVVDKLTRGVPRFAALGIAASGLRVLGNFRV